MSAACVLLDNDVSDSETSDIFFELCKHITKDICG